MDPHEALKIASGLLGLLMYAPLVRHAVKNNGAGQSFAMWALWAVLDSTLTISIILQRGNFLLFAGFAVGSITLASVLLIKGRFSWGRLETVVTMLVILCLLIWKLSGPRMATVATTAAIVIAGLPAVIELWRDPQRELANVWLGYATANLLAFLAGTDWSLEQRFAPGVFVVQTLVLAAIGYRPKPASVPVESPG